VAEVELSIPEYPYYQDVFGWKPDASRHAICVGRHTVSLPLSGKLTDNDIPRVVAAVRNAVVNKVGGVPG